MKNRVMMQAFEWYLESDSKHFVRLEQLLDELKEAGIDDLWIPPVFKATGTNDVGYGIYDLFDLGEFDQKGSVPTKYGTKEELLSLIEACHQRGMKVYADTVLNHKAGADFKETFKAVLVDSDNREENIGDPHDIEGWTGFNFPGRNDKYSDFKWNFNHFTGVDYDDLSKETGIFRILGENKYWSSNVSHEMGNYDYLMFADVDLKHPDVSAELFRWIEWFVQETKIDGLRFDALKHIDRDFIRDFTSYCQEQFGESFYMVGEYWSSSEAVKAKYLDATDYNVDLFDVGLHFNFYEAALGMENYDLREIFENTLVSTHPTLAVTFVDNHDSQKGQSLQSWVGDWFKPLAYTLILMRDEGYPCVFWGDYYGINQEDGYPASKPWIDKILKARASSAHGQQDDYFDNNDTIGWVRHGDEEHPTKSATLIHNGTEKTSLMMFVGKEQANKEFSDVLSYDDERVVIDEEGFGDFTVNAQSAAIWMAL